MRKPEKEKLMIQYFSPMEVTTELPTELVSGKPLVGIPNSLWRKYSGKIEKRLDWFEKLVSTILRGYLRNIENGLTKPKEHAVELNAYYCELGLLSVEEILNGERFDFWCNLAGLDPEICVKLFEKTLGAPLEQIREKLINYVREVRHERQQGENEVVSVCKSSEDSRSPEDGNI